MTISYNVIKLTYGGQSMKKCLANLNIILPNGDKVSEGTIFEVSEEDYGSISLYVSVVAEEKPVEVKVVIPQAKNSKDGLNLDSLSDIELKALAKEMKVSGWALMKKRESLIKAIKEAKC